MNEPLPSDKPSSRRIFDYLYGLAFALGAISIIETRLSVFVVLLLIIALASLSRSQADKRWAWALGCALVLATIGLGRFIFKEALPGIAEARGRDSSKHAVSMLREIYFAQNAMRRYAMIDPDQDKVGSAARLGELTAQVLARGSIRLPNVPLAPRLSPRIETAHGQATEYQGYLFYVCLPQADGKWTAQTDALVDEEKSERNWLAYAWPSAANLGHKHAYVIDQHERILEFNNEQNHMLIFMGAAFAPPCDSLFNPGPDIHWDTWSGKTPRAELPGDIQ